MTLLFLHQAQRTHCYDGKLGRRIVKWKSDEYNQYIINILAHCSSSSFPGWVCEPTTVDDILLFYCHHSCMCSALLAGRDECVFVVESKQTSK